MGFDDLCVINKCIGTIIYVNRAIFDYKYEGTEPSKYENATGTWPYIPLI